MAITPHEFPIRKRGLWTKGGLLRSFIGSSRKQEETLDEF